MIHYNYYIRLFLGRDYGRYYVKTRWCLETIYNVDNKMNNECGAVGGMISDGENGSSYSVETRPSANRTTISPIWHNLGTNPLHRGGKSVNNLMSNGTAYGHHDDNKKLASIQMVKSPIRFTQTGVNNSNICSLIKGDAYIANRVPRKGYFFRTPK